jgi:hypothetical protein
LKFAWWGPPSPPSPPLVCIYDCGTYIIHSSITNLRFDLWFT